MWIEIQNKEEIIKTNNINEEDVIDFIDLVFSYAVEYHLIHKVNLSEFVCYIAEKNNIFLYEDKVRETIENSELIIN